MYLYNYLLVTDADAGARRLRSAETRTLVVGHTHKVLLAIDHLLQHPIGSGTVCCLPQDYLTCPMVSLGGHLSHFWGY